MLQDIVINLGDLGGKNHHLNLNLKIKEKYIKICTYSTKRLSNVALLPEESIVVSDDAPNQVSRHFYSETIYMYTNYKIKIINGHLHSSIQVNLTSY